MKPFFYSSKFLKRFQPLSLDVFVLKRIFLSLNISEAVSNAEFGCVCFAAVFLSLNIAEAVSTAHGLVRNKNRFKKPFGSMAPKIIVTWSPTILMPGQDGPLRWTQPAAGPLPTGPGVLVRVAQQGVYMNLEGPPSFPQAPWWNKDSAASSAAPAPPGQRAGQDEGAAVPEHREGDGPAAASSTLGEVDEEMDWYRRRDADGSCGQDAGHWQGWWKNSQQWWDTKAAEATNGAEEDDDDWGHWKVQKEEPAPEPTGGCNAQPGPDAQPGQEQGEAAGQDDAAMKTEDAAGDPWFGIPNSKRHVWSQLHGGWRKKRGGQALHWHNKQKHVDWGPMHSWYHRKEQEKKNR